MGDIALLEQLLKLQPLPSKDENNKNIRWPDVEKIIDKSGYEVEGGTNVSRLRNFLIAVINDLPDDGKLRLRKQTVRLVGKVWTHLILNGNTYSNAKKPIRDAVKNKWYEGDFKAGEDFLRAPDVQFDDRERTIAVNAAGEQKSDKRQENAVEISAERVEKIVEQMKEDLDSGDSKYNVVAILLGDLCFGSRWIESLMYSKFVPDEEQKKTGRNNVLTNWITQTGISKKFNRGVDNRNMSVHKPCLPYIHAKYVVDKINAFRDAHPELKVKLLNYDSANKNDRLLANRYRYKANQLVAKRYFKDMFSRAESKAKGSDQRAASSHLLRAIWVNLSYELFHKKGQAKDKYVKDTLGHDSYSPGIRYKDVIIVPAKEDDALANLSFATVKASELKEPENIDFTEMNDDIAEEPDQPNEPNEPNEPTAPAPVSAPKVARADSDELASLRSEVKEMRADIKRLTTLLERFITGQVATPKQPAAPAPDVVIRRSARNKK